MLSKIKTWKQYSYLNTTFMLSCLDPKRQIQYSAGTMLNDDKHHIMTLYSQVERKGDSAINEIHNLDLVQQFEGSENRLHKYGYYSFPINCNQDFSSYPFDRQVCQLEILIDALAGGFVTLTPQSESVGRTQKSFGSFAITNITLKSLTSRSHQHYLHPFQLQWQFSKFT